VHFSLLIPSIIALLLVFDRALRIYARRKIADIFENVPPFNVRTESAYPDARVISISASDGVKLTGSVHMPSGGSAQGLVIFFPELNGNHWMARRYCEALLADGFAILAFDFRNQGDSDQVSSYQPIHWITDFEMNDVSGVMEFIESDPQLNTLPLLAFGVSRGGVAALVSAGRYPRIRGVIADSAFGTMPMIHHYVNRFAHYVIPSFLYQMLPQWHVRMTLRQGIQYSEKRRHCRYVHLESEAFGLASTPVLLISGDKDSYVIEPIARQLQSTCGSHAVLWTVRGAKHNMARDVAMADYDRRITEHFRRSLDLAIEKMPDAATSEPLDRSAARSHFIQPA
jgi:pimeloyl-ACP methyl ester carboxylesterase